MHHGAYGGSGNANAERVLKVLPSVQKRRSKTPARVAKKKAAAKSAPSKAKAKSSAAKKSSARKAAPKKAGAATRSSAKVASKTTAKAATSKKKTSAKAAVGEVALVSVDKRDDPKLKKLIDLGKERGFLTSNELSQGLPKQLA